MAVRKSVPSSLLSEKKCVCVCAWMYSLMCVHVFVCMCVCVCVCAREHNLWIASVNEFCEYLWREARRHNHPQGNNRVCACELLSMPLVLILRKVCMINALCVSEGKVLLACVCMCVYVKRMITSRTMISRDDLRNANWESGMLTPVCYARMRDTHKNTHTHTHSHTHDTQF